MQDPGSVERQFYLDHFRGRSILLAEQTPSDLAGLVTLLTSAGARIIWLGHHDAPLSMTDDELVPETLALLRDGGVARVRPAEGTDALVAGVALARLLRPSKLVLICADAPAGGGGTPSFITLPAAAGTVRAQADSDNHGGLAAMAADALEAGVGSVNACRPGQVTDELLTYEGAGVLFTPGGYCQVQRLRLDDFDAAGRLIDQGVAAGYLKQRSRSDVLALLLDGYAARFADDDHLAGFAALLRGPYAHEQVAEISALTTISRFSGGGVGGMIVSRMLADARLQQLRGVFAATTAAAAVGFFQALGFRRVEQEAIPAAKWRSYDGQRRSHVVALWHDLSDIGPWSGG